MTNTITRLALVAMLLSTAACSEGPLTPSRQEAVGAQVVSVQPTGLTPVPPAIYTCAERDKEVQAYIASRGNAFDTAMVTLSSGETVYIEWQFDPETPRRVHHVSGPVCQ